MEFCFFDARPAEQDEINDLFGRVVGLNPDTSDRETFESSFFFVFGVSFRLIFEFITAWARIDEVLIIVVDVAVVGVAVAVVV